MKTVQTFILILFCTTPFWGQWYQNFTNLQDAPCFGDPDILVSKPENWTIYQTLEDTWDGTIDSSICINTSIGTTNLIVPINQIDTSRSVFIRYSFDESNKVLLQKDNIYSLTMSSSAEGFVLNQNSDCSNDLCSGSIFGIQYQNEDATGFNIRYHTNAEAEGYNNSCISTEPFPENWLRECIFKFTVDTDFDPTENATFSLWPIYLEDNFSQGNISAANIPEYTFTGNAYEVPLETIQDPPTYNYANNYLALNTSWPDVYPGPMNIHYIDATLNPNQAEQAIINIHIAYYESLNFQAFTQFRGDLIEDSDSIRHIVNLVQDGGNMCLEDWVEIVIHDDRKFIYKEGQIDFNGRTACMQFRSGGTLEIAPGSTLHYGPDGQGMLLLKTGGFISFKEKSHLEINNAILLRSYHPDLNNLESNQIFVDLPLNSSLKFGEQAKILTHLGEEHFMRLNINMLGGEIDLSNLDPVSRSYINLIYPENIPTYNQTLNIHPNPASDFIQLEWNSSVEEIIQFQLFDLQGRLLFQKSIPAHIDANRVEINLPSLLNGLYLVQIDSPSQGKTTRKLNFIQ